MFRTSTVTPAYAHAVCLRGLIWLQDRPSGRRNLYPHQQAEQLDLCENDRSARTMGGNGSEVPQWEISREEYDQWRYRYPRSEAERNEKCLKEYRGE